MQTSSISPIRFISNYWKQKYGMRVQKITIDAGMTCPNRDGKLGWGGCTFCNNESFSPALKNRGMKIRDQLISAKERLKLRYHCQHFLAYFQSYSNTYAPIDILRQYYEEALNVDGVIGLVIGTRPDCFTDELITYLSELSKRVELIVEVGLESFEERTLNNINRGHGVNIFYETVAKLTKANVKVGTHLIFGLPDDRGVSPENWARKLSHLPIHSIKIHQLQVIKGTKMSKDYIQCPFKLLSKNEYQEILISFLRNLSSHIYVDRLFAQSPSHLLQVSSQDWQINAGGFRDELIAMMNSRAIRQGDQWD